MKQTDKELEWIGKHATDDTVALRLKYGHDERMSLLIDQIEARRKAGNKVKAELERCPSFVFPTVLSAEQCTGDYLADYHASLVKEGDCVLDMTCGLGIDAFHIAGRGCHVTACDLNPLMVEAATENVDGLGLSSNFRAVNCDSLDFLRGNDVTYDVIFVDPARRGAGGKRLYALKDCSPDVVTNLPLIMSRCRRLIVKASPMLDVTAVRREFASTAEVDIIATGTTDECKELIIVYPGSGRLKAVTIARTDVTVEVDFDEGRDDEPPMKEPETGEYLYETFPAVNKCGRFGSIARRYGVSRLSKNVQLYVSGHHVEDFPGRGYRVIEVVPFGKREVRELLSRYGEMSVTTRDFPLSSSEFKKKFKTGESRQYRLWAVTLPVGRRLIVTERHQSSE